MKIALYRIAFLAAFLAMWEAASNVFDAGFFISRPSLVAASFLTMISNGSFFYNLSITATEAALGFLFGAIFGIGAGLLLGRLKLLADILDPFLITFYSLPKVALAPLFILWFGIGIDMKVILAAVTVFFLVFLNTYTGVRSVSPEQIAILRLMGAGERALISKVIVPSALTWVFTGLRLSVPYALIGAIVGEIIAANRGIGYILSDAAAQFDTAAVFAALIGIVVLSLIFNGIVRFAERALMPWKAGEGTREISI
ncbi:ABC transporter permease [Xanthobacter sp. KR7-225]|uniref:ABC transporter permease n=1 Tax=Xanthobacter sp. KR7-225 TaxID=3156613 RepID=UPI0032B314DE